MTSQLTPVLATTPVTTRTLAKMSEVPLSVSVTVPAMRSVESTPRHTKRSVNVPSVSSTLPERLAVFLVSCFIIKFMKVVLEVVFLNISF